MTDFNNPTMWKALERAYMAPERHYHTLTHLAHMFALYDNLATRIHWKGPFRAAVWFHDWVYETDPGAYNDNETHSGKMLYAAGERQRSHGELTMHDPFLRVLAEAFILATRRHQPDDSLFALQPAARKDCELFLDIDLAIFACSPAQVQGYDSDIRSEFGAWSDAEFAAARVANLERFLARERIFLSDTFKPWEAKARENINMLVTRWRRGIRPENPATRLN